MLKSSRICVSRFLSVWSKITEPPEAGHSLPSPTSTHNGISEVERAGLYRQVMPITLLIFTSLTLHPGTGTTLASVRQAIYTLRRLLSPNYAVIPITESVLLKEPWAPTCALLVFPGGADLGYCRVLNGAGNRLISAYVRYAGGKYLGFCAGGYYASARCEFEVGSEDKGMEVVGKRELGFYQGTCRGGAFKGFGYGSEKGARAARVKVREEVFDEHEVPREFNCYYNGGGVFVDAEKVGAVGVEILAEYGDEIDVGSGERRAAVVYCKVGEGAALLTGPHPE